MFASTDLARRIERAESELSADIAHAAERRQEPGAFALPLWGGVAAFAGQGSPINKFIGAGFDTADGLDETALEQVEGMFAQRQTPMQAEIAILADPRVALALTRRGFLLEGFENVLGRRLEPAAADEPEDRSGVIVRPVEASDHQMWRDLVATAFEHPDPGPGGAPPPPVPRDALDRAYSDFAETRGYRAYLATIGGVPAGGGALRLFDGVAQLCGAGTVPSFRRRGVQTALLRSRLADAQAAGCDVATVTTQPGTRSQQNSQANGFALLYTRAVLVRHW